MAKRPPAPRQGPIRCAIYTRKSTEEGLEQEFNSLDAQREACAAYITSQRHEGWTLIATAYDDGGFSGGSMERPGLKQLMADVAAGQVDVIVVYKVDRLTRSLADFAKIVEVLDGAGASFVSVTQAFNTTTSMGRLTLNVLLSFAQFEREVTGERIRDKVAASKRKGMWMGGVVPLGYDVQDRKLIVNEADAATVRHIFTRYRALRSIGDLAAELGRDNIRSKRRMLACGDAYGGRPFSKGALAHLLQNKVYIGQITHKGEDYNGEHRSIVDRSLFDAVQDIIADNRVAKRLQSRAEHPSLLAGMIVDGAGRRMTPSHATKGVRRYRYYVTAPDAAGVMPQSAWRVPAGEVEKLVVWQVADWLGDRSATTATCLGLGCSGAHDIVQRLADAGQRLNDGPEPERRRLLQSLHAEIALGESGITITIDAATMVEDVSISLPPFELHVDAKLARRGQELRIVLPPRERAEHPQTDPKLVALLAKAELAHDELGTGTTIEAARRPHLIRLARLKFLAPDITAAILEGRQPPSMTARALLRASAMPLAWADQRIELGFA